MIDVYLAMFMALALLLFMLAERQPKRRRIYLAGMYASIGLGVLTKGPVAVLLPALVFFIYLAASRSLRKIRELMLPAGVAIIAMIVLPWYVAVYAQHGWGYIQDFILRDNFSRFAEQVWGPSRGPLFYVGVIAGDFFPWSLFFAAALWCEARERSVWRRAFSRSATADPTSPITVDAAKARHSALLIVWIIVIVSFFSLSRSKEDLYILPIYPAAAAIAGKLLARWLGDSQLAELPVRVTAAMMGIVLLVGGAGVLYLFGGGAQGYELGGATAIGSTAIVGGVIAILAVAVRKRLLTVLAPVTAVVICNWIFVLRTLPDFERYKPVRPLCEVAFSKPRDSLVGYYRLASPSMTFYLRRPIFEYFTPEEIIMAFSSGKDVYCVMTSADYDALKDELPAPAHVLARRPIFQVKLKRILDRSELPQVLLVSNKAE